MNKSLQIALWAMIVTVFSSLLYVGYLFFIPVEIFTINSIRMTTPTVTAGDDATYFVDYCRPWSGNIHVFKSIDGPSLIYIPETINANPTGCRTAEVSVHIPTYADPGVYKIKIVSEAQVNPLQKVVVRFETDTFIVE